MACNVPMFLLSPHGARLVLRKKSVVYYGISLRRLVKLVQTIVRLRSFCDEAVS